MEKFVTKLILDYSLTVDLDADGVDGNGELAGGSDGPHSQGTNQGHSEHTCKKRWKTVFHFSSS